MDPVWRLQRGRRVVEEEERAREQERGVEKENSRDSVFISLSIALKCAELYRLLPISRRIYRYNWLDRHRYCTPAEWGCYLAAIAAAAAAAADLLFQDARLSRCRKPRQLPQRLGTRARRYDEMAQEQEIRCDRGSKINKKKEKSQESVAYNPII
jgi:hypothetical protein